MRSPDISDSNLDWQPISVGSLPRHSRWWAWVSDAGSLTERLKLASQGDFHVELLGEAWVSDVPFSVRKLFGPVNESHRFWSRKVRLIGCGRCWVQAHTLIPEFSLISPLKQILDLNTKPLGEYLFNQPQLVRSELDVTPTGSDTWGRRSLFFLFGKPILVAEFFLEDLLDSVPNIPSEN